MESSDSLWRPLRREKPYGEEEEAHPANDRMRLISWYLPSSHQQLVGA